MYGTSRKAKRALKDFSRDPNKLQRLQHYIDSLTLNSSLQLLPSCEKSVNCDGVSQLKNRRQLKNLSVSCDENFINMGIRDIYLKNNVTTSTPVTPDYSSSRTTDSDQLVNKPSERGTSNVVRNLTPVSNNRKRRFKRNEIETIQSSLPHRVNGAKETLHDALKHSQVKMSDLGGLSKELGEIENLLSQLQNPEDLKKYGPVPPPRGLLLNGPSGCGKTLLAHAVAGELDWPIIKLNLTGLDSVRLERQMKQVFETAVNASPCILHLDELDSLLIKKDHTQKETDKKITAQVMNCIDGLNSQDNFIRVFVIGETSEPDLIEQKLRQAGRFEKEINIRMPNEKERIEIFDKISKYYNISADFDVSWLARNTPGYVGRDLGLLLNNAAGIAFQRNQKMPVDDTSEKQIITEDFEKALSVCVPLKKREGFAEVSGVTWSQIGALKKVQEELQMAILWPIKYKEKLKKFFISATAGILLCGPKGCGKTLLAKAIANECSINFLSVKGPELLSKYVGESEYAIRNCFRKAEYAAPCVIFFDEVDSLCPSRSYSDDNGTSNRVVAQLLTELDGIRERKEVFVIGATNRPDSMDSALLRPGRFGKVIFVDVPSPADRHEILCAITKNGTEPQLGTDVCLDNLAKDTRCSRFSGADLKNLVETASFLALKDSIMSETEDPEVVKMIHFNQAFDNVKPSITKRDANIFKRMKYTIDNGVKCKKRKICAELSQ